LKKPEISVIKRARGGFSEFHKKDKKILDKILKVYLNKPNIFCSDEKYHVIDIKPSLISIQLLTVLLGG